MTQNEFPITYYNSVPIYTQVTDLNLFLYLLPVFSLLPQVIKPKIDVNCHGMISRMSFVFTEYTKLTFPYPPLLSIPFLPLPFRAFYLVNPSFYSTHRLSHSFPIPFPPSFLATNSSFTHLLSSNIESHSLPEIKPLIPVIKA